jgi:hypothetical protein
MKKQLEHYSKNRDLINLKIPQINTKSTKSIKPNDINREKKDVTELINSALCIAPDGENKPILSLYDLLVCAETCFNPERQTTRSNKMKTTFSVLPEIVQYITKFEQASFSEIKLQFKDRLSERQLRRRMPLLVNLKWLIRRGKNDFTVYYPNPFLAAMWKRDEYYRTPNTFYLEEYSRLKVDFFQLLNVPLLNALKSKNKITKTEIQFVKYAINKTPWIRAFFEGFVNIKLYTECGNKYHTQLPVNFHASAKIIGYDRESKKPVIDPYGFPHHTVPLSWKLFDIVEGREYTKKGRASRRAKEIGTYEYIHFDNSFKILHYVDAQQYLMFNAPFKNALKKWNTDTCQYVEVGDFLTLQKLFHERFVNGKRRQELFDALKLDYKVKSGRPKSVISDSFSQGLNL